MTTPQRIRYSFASSLFALFTFFSVHVLAQNSDREFEDYLEYDHHLEILTSDGKVAITPISEKIIEIQFLTEHQPANPKSWSVIQEPANIEIEIDENDDSVFLNTEGVSVEVVKEPFQIKYSYKGNALTSENLGYFEEDKMSGFKFNLGENEAIYGGGERALGMDRRGNKMALYNTPAYGYTSVREDMYYSIPLVISSNKYMILFDNAPKGVLDTGKADKDVLSMYSIGGRKVYYIIAGEDFYDLNTQYTGLTGRQPLPPRWTLGHIASRFGYHTQAEAEDTLKKMKDADVPVDGLVIDLYWFGKDIQGHMGNLDWDYEAWPKPKKMMKNFKKQGVNTVLITEPFILKTSKRWQEAVDENILAKNYRGEDYVFDFYFGTSGIIDIFKPEAKEWFWDIYKKHTDTGVGAWWGDLGEPESHSSDIVHVAGTADYVHNVYGHEWAKTLYDGYTKDYPNKRPVALMRAGFAGSQRYGMIPWSGDVSRQWDGLKPQPALTMQMGMQGLAYMHSDLGGFAPHYVDDKLFSDPMLYTRWMQYGVFQPVYRPHSHESSAPEPVFWDDRTLDLTREAINLRYQLFAYNYTLAYENTIKGYPFMRPLFYVEEDASLWDYSDTYLWGDNILVAPILESKQKTQKVRFPKGGNWVDFYNGKRYQGGTSTVVDVVEEYIPTYVRSGHFLPLIPKGMQTTRDYSTSMLDVLYFADASVSESSYTLYDDDGITHHSIKNNKHELLTFSSKVANGKYELTISSNGGKFKGRPKSRKINLLIDHLDSLPANVSVNGVELAVLGTDVEPNKKQKSYAKQLGDKKISIVHEHKGGEATISF